jgi:hypothetical protein
MAYADVQRYAKVYAAQELFNGRQRETLARLTSALAIFGTGHSPDEVPAEDMRTFRARLLELSGDVTIEQQFGQQLLEAYSKILNK